MKEIRLADGSVVVKAPKPRRCRNWYQRFGGTLYVGRKHPKPANEKQIAKFNRLYGTA